MEIFPSVIVVSKLAFFSQEVGPSPSSNLNRYFKPKQDAFLVLAGFVHDMKEIKEFSLNKPSDAT